jgi:hypothetical protein
MIDFLISFKTLEIRKENLFKFLFKLRHEVIYVRKKQTIILIFMIFMKYTCRT